MTENSVREGRRYRSRSRDRNSGPLRDMPLASSRDHYHDGRNNQRNHSHDNDRGDVRKPFYRNHRDDDQKKKTKKMPAYEIVNAPLDEKLGNVQDDPRGTDPTKRITKKASGRGKGRNTESFDPSSTLVRPDLRVQVGSPLITEYNKPLKHDDVVIVPELFGQEENWDMYYKLVEEMREVQAKNEDGSDKGSSQNKRSTNGPEWIPWHEGAHLITKKPDGSPTYQKIIDRLCEYFSIERKSVGTRFNWYRDSSDWKPFHHDSAAFNPKRAKTQNITVGASFGATRELAFIRAREYKNDDKDGNAQSEKCRLYFPQTNNGAFSFGRDANILWKHGINALAPTEQDGKGRISIILWGNAKKAIEEDGSPDLLGADGTGPHANGRNNGRRGRGDGRNGRGGGSKDWHEHRRDDRDHHDRRYHHERRRDNDRMDYYGDRRDNDRRDYRGDHDRRDYDRHYHHGSPSRYRNREDRGREY